MIKEQAGLKYFRMAVLTWVVSGCTPSVGGSTPKSLSVVTGVDAGMVVASAPEPSGGPRFPFEAKTRGETHLFRTPKASDESVTVPAGMVLTVTEASLKGKRNGQELLFVTVKPTALSALYAFLDDLEPLEKGVSISDEDASALMLRNVPEPQRAWCQKSVRRILLPGEGSEGASMLAFSSSAEQACLGYLALFGRSNGKPHVIAVTRRAGALLDVTPRMTAQGLLIDVREGILGDINRSGVVRALLAPKPSSFLKEILLIEESVQDHKVSPPRRLSGSLELLDTSSGVELSVRHIEEELGAGGTKTRRREEKLRYLYSKGEVTTAHHPAAH